MKEGSRNGASLSKEALRKEPGGRVPLMGTPKDMLSKALEMVLFPQEPRFWGTWRDAPFLGPLREAKIFFIEGNIYEEFEIVKKAL